MAYGQVAEEFGGVKLKLEVLESARGFYIGTLEDGLPYSRESEEYWPKRELAERALATGDFEQRFEP